VQLKVFGGTLIRRWYLVILGLIFAAIAALLTMDKVGPTYEAKGVMLIMPPVKTVQQSTGSLGNPYFMLDGLTAIRDIVIGLITAQATHDELCHGRADPTYEAMRVALCKPNPSVTYKAEADSTNNAPVILLTVDANSATNATVALNALEERVPRVLSNVQAGLSLQANAQITSIPLSTDTKPATVRKSQIRAGIVAGAGTLALSLLLIGLVDGLLAARRSKLEVDGRAQAVSTAVAPESEVEADETLEAGTYAGAEQAPKLDTNAEADQALDPDIWAGAEEAAESEADFEMPAEPDTYAEAEETPEADLEMPIEATSDAREAAEPTNAEEGAAEVAVDPDTDMPEAAGAMAPELQGQADVATEPKAGAEVPAEPTNAEEAAAEVAVDPDPDTETETETKADAEVSPEPEGEAEVSPEPEAEVTETKPQAQVLVEPTAGDVAVAKEPAAAAALRPEAKAVKPAPDAAIAPEPEPDAASRESEPLATAQPEPEPHAESGADTQPRWLLWPDDAEPEPQADAALESETQVGVELETDAAIAPVPEPETDAAAELGHHTAIADEAVPNGQPSEEPAPPKKRRTAVAARR
jgi:hypothetical protein